MKLTEQRITEIIREELSEAKKRDYKAEYKKYGSSKKAKKYRAELNAYNRKKGTYGNGDKKDASHKGGKIVGFEEQSKNRGRREKSRLKKEIAVRRDKEGKMAKFDAKEACQDAADVFKMIDEYDDLPEWLEAKITKASDYLNSVKDYLEHHHSGKNEVQEDFGMAAKQMPKFSSREAKTIIDSSLRDYAKILRKAQQKVIKDWMSMAKAGKFDFFDLVRGLQWGDASRAHPYETKFLMSILNKDKIMNRFKSYFGGKKAMNNRMNKRDY